MRSFKSAFTFPFLRKYQDGVMKYRYRGIECLRSPIDAAIQAHAIWELQPGTYIEIGSHHGGGALWAADLLGNYGLDTHVYSIDITVPQGVKDDRITFAEGDVMNLGPAFEKLGLLDAPRPWYVIEDSAHTYDCCAAALDFLSKHLQKGDVLVMEDGVLDELGVSESYGGGPNRAIKEFMEANPGVLDLAEDLCDMFGQNATYATNGYFRKT